MNTAEPYDYEDCARVACAIIPATYIDANNNSVKILFTYGFADLKKPELMIHADDITASYNLLVEASELHIQNQLNTGEFTASRVMNEYGAMWRMNIRKLNKAENIVVCSMFDQAYSKMIGVSNEPIWQFGIWNLELPDTNNNIPTEKNYNPQDYLNIQQPAIH